MTDLTQSLIDPRFAEEDDDDGEAFELQSPGADPMITSPNDADPYAEAAIYLKEGLSHTDFAFHPTTKYQQRLFQYSTSLVYRILEIVVCLVYLGLVFIDKPAVYQVNPRITASIEMTCAGFFLYNLSVKARVSGGWLDYVMPRNELFFWYFGPHPNSRRVSVRHMTRVIVVAAVIVGSIVSFVLEDDLTMLGVLRPLLILDTSAFAGPRRVLRQILQSVWYIRWMTMLLLLFVLISSVLAYYFFSANPHETNFKNLEQSFISLFVLMTTANYPDVMMQAFTYTRIAPVFFVIFLILGLYTISNIFLAFVFDFYQVTEKAKYRSIFLHRRRAVRLAYDEALKADDRGINRAAFGKILKCFNPHIKERDLTLSFYMLDSAVDNDGYISNDEFYRFYEVYGLTWRIDYSKTIGREYQYAPTKGWSSWRLSLRDLVKHRWFDYIVNSIIFANLVYVVVEASLHSGGDQPSAVYQLVFSFFFLAEVIIKILGFGTKAYFQDGWNMFDFTIVVVSVSLAVVELAVAHREVGAYITVARAVRLARIFRTHQTFKQIVEVIVYLYPKAARFFVALLCVFYFFATIAMRAFSNTVSRCDNDMCANRTCGLDNYLVRDTSAGGLNFQLMSFDNILLACNTLFHLMVVNNWQITMEAHVCATEQRTTRIFFFVYYLLTVIVVSNVVVAFVLDAFQVLYDKRTSKDPESANYALRVLEVSVPRDVAKRFLSEDNPALQADTVHFRAVKKETALYDLLYANDIKQWVREDLLSSGEVRVEVEPDWYIELDV